MKRKKAVFDLARYKHRADVIKALAHPTRLFIVEALGEGERCVSEIRESVKADMSTVSRHLTVLRHAGVIACDKRGLQVFYRLQTPCLLEFLNCIDVALEQDLETRQLCLGAV